MSDRSPQAPEPLHQPGRLASGFAAAVVRLRWFVLAFWALVSALALLALPALESDAAENLRGLVPDDTPAVETEIRSVELFGFPLLGRTVLVQRRADGLTVYDQARTVTHAVGVNSGQYQDLGPLRGVLPITNTGGLFPGSSERDTTALSYLFVEPGATFSAQSRAARRYAERYFNIRDDIVGVTGSVPARALQGRIIRDRLPLVETLTLGAIVAIVGINFASVVAPAVTLVTTAVAFTLTLRLSGYFTEFFNVASPTELEPVVVALLLGVVTDYVVFYCSALRHELTLGADRLTAARNATATFAPIIGVAGLAVAAGTAALLVAESAFFQALGPALVFTVFIGLTVAITLVPALMAVLGRWLFWPTWPRPRTESAESGELGEPGDAGEPETTDESGELSEPNATGEPGPTSEPGEPGPTGERGEPGEPGATDGVEVDAPRPSSKLSPVGWITTSRRNAALTVAACVGALTLAALPLLRLDLGVSFVGSLPTNTAVAKTANAAEAGFTPGILAPTVLLVEGVSLGDRQTSLSQLGEQLKDVDGVAGVLGPQDEPAGLELSVLLAETGTAARFLVVLEDEPLGATAIHTIDRIQDTLPRMLGASGLADVDAGLAGDSATASFIVEQTEDDLLRIAVAALLANLLMLTIFLRALVAPLYLLVATVLSLGAALGLTTLVFDLLAPGVGLTFYVPFAAAVLLLAFGSDYNIFGVGHVWDVARRRPLTAAIRVAMPQTTRAINAAGIALAASFGLLAVVPLGPFRQLAFAMAVGILIDVLVVRSVLMPALLTLVGPASAWPNKRLLAQTKGSNAAAAAPPGAAAAAAPPSP